MFPILQLSYLALATLGVAVTSVGIWWLVRRRERRFWIPTLSILPPLTRRRALMVLRRPPLIAFLCFLVSVLALATYVFEPQHYEPKSEAAGAEKVHVFVDLSPSMSAGRSLEDVSEMARTVVEPLSMKGARLTWSTSHSDEVLAFQGAADLAARIRGMDFHRSGAKLGRSLAARMPKIGDVDRLVLISDGDRHSWDDFDWTFFTGRSQVQLVRPDGDSATVANNVFINRVTPRVVDGSSGARAWDVEIANIGSCGSCAGTLQVLENGVLLHSEPWELRDNERLAVAVVVNDAAERPGTAKRAGGGTDVLQWHLEPRDADRITMDNDFYSSEASHASAAALVISAPFGERLLESPTYQLQTTLSVLGLQVVKRDAPEFSLSGAPADLPPNLIVAVGGSGLGEKAFCPVVTTNSGPSTKIWLAPSSLDADFGELCRCLALLQADTANSGANACEGVQDRATWVSFLRERGAGQVGGDISESSGALAWVVSETILALTVPLQPLHSTGVDHARFPLMVRDLLAWQKIRPKAARDTAMSWPRWDDVSMKGEDARVPNVPYGESLGKELGQTSLPPTFSIQTFGNHAADGRSSHLTAEPYILILAYLLVLALVVEALSALVALLRRRGRDAAGETATETAASLLLICLLGGLPLWTDDVLARENVVTYQWEDASSDMKRLADEVRQRTSIELEAKARNLRSAAELENLAEGWLWARHLSAITGKDGRMVTPLATWLERGGFLIIEDPTANDTALNRFAQAIGRGTSDPGAWRAIPVDHELMRSFYLIDSLPTCERRLWRGFTFDGRLAMLVIPMNLLDALNHRTAQACGVAQETLTRAFVNILMVALATDYKRDQIHLPEILKRLR